MTMEARSGRAVLPAVDRLLRSPGGRELIDRYGRAATLEAMRRVLAELRAADTGATDTAILAAVQAALAALMRPSQRRVFNLTGTVLHTNLGRALLPEEAVEAAATAMRSPTTLEYDLVTGRRGERDAHVEHWLKRLTGAAAATIVNNNAAAVLLVLNALAQGREVLVSRGELVEIGGSFRLPDIMASAGCRLREVGTTNRTHLGDFAEAVGGDTALILKIHTSNYVIQGFTASVPPRDLADLARRSGIPFVEDLGSGTLVDLETFGLPHEPTARQSIAQGADIVTFSGDKLLGGPQAGIIAGRADLVARIAKSPMKRALRLDKLRLAALEAVLALYADPDRLTQCLPTLRLLCRPRDDIAALGERLMPVLRRRLADQAEVTLIDCHSQIGSGALPLDLLPSIALAMAPTGQRSGAVVEGLAAAFRALPIPVIGRIAEDRLLLDLRCLEDEAAFTGQLAALSWPERGER